MSTIISYIVTRRENNSKLIAGAMWRFRGQQRNRWTFSKNAQHPRSSGQEQPGMRAHGPRVDERVLQAVLNLIQDVLNIDAF